jgi:hypothetical protein
LALGTYFAPCYFSPFYFPPLGSSTSVETTSTEKTFNDCDAIGAIIERLTETGAFEGVFLDGPRVQGISYSACNPIALVRHEGWREYDDVDPVAILRTVSFSISIAVRMPDTVQGLSELSRLDSVVRLAISGTSLDGCLPSLTTLQSGEYDAHILQPDAVLRVKGEFSYLV